MKQVETDTAHTKLRCINASSEEHVAYQIQDRLTACSGPEAHGSETRRVRFRRVVPQTSVGARRCRFARRGARARTIQRLRYPDTPPARTVTDDRMARVRSAPDRQ